MFGKIRMQGLSHSALPDYSYGRLFIIIGIQPLGRFGQRPELSQATGIALVRCILGKFLGVVCHCFMVGYTYIISKN